MINVWCWFIVLPALIFMLDRRKMNAKYEVFDVDKGCSIFDCSPGGERKFFWPPHPPIFFKFSTGFWPHPHIFFDMNMEYFRLSEPHPHIFFTFFPNLAPHPHILFCKSVPPQGYNQKWNHPNTMQCKKYNAKQKYNAMPTMQFCNKKLSHEKCNVKNCNAMQSHE